jgi:Tol biopolymer transport system component
MTASALLVLGTALSAPSVDSKRGIRLSGPMALTYGGDVFDWRVSPDGTRVVYRGDTQTDGLVELFSAPSDGSAAPTKLNGAIASGGLLQGYRISPDSTRVVFWGDVVTNDVNELFSVPIDGSAAPVKLNGPLAPLGDVATATNDPGVRISPESELVVFLADANTGPAEVFELFSVPLDGSAAPTKLNGTLVSGGDVGIIRFSGFEQLWDPGFQISPDGERVLYLADQEIDGRRNLYSVPIGGGAAVRLNDPVGQGGSAGSGLTPGYRISPDSSWVTFISDQDGDGWRVLYGAPIDGGLPAVRISDDAPIRVQEDLWITADSSRVVYRADTVVPPRMELFSVPIDGGAAPTPLAGASGFPAVEAGFQISASHAVYRRQGVLHSVPIDGSAAPLALSGPRPLTSVDVPLAITPDGSRVVYRSAQDSQKVELYSVPVDGSAAPVQLNPPLVPDGNVDEFALDPNGDRAVYSANGQHASMLELYSVPVDASAPAVKLNAPFVPNGDLIPSQTHPGFEVGPAGTVTYRADQEIDGVNELYGVPIDASVAPVKLNELMPGPSVAGDVKGFVLSRDGGHVVYRADQESDEVYGLYGVPLPDSPADPVPPPVPLSDPYVDVEFGFDVSPDGSRVVYRASPDDEGRQGLYSVPIDGSALALRLSAPSASVSEFRITPDSTRIVYREARRSIDLRVVPIDGSGPATTLNPPFEIAGRGPAGQLTSLSLGAPGQVASFRIAPDASHVVYLADHDERGTFELFGVPIDLSRGARKLNGALAPGQGISNYALSLDSRRVIFLAGQRLFSAPIGGRSPAVALAPEALRVGGCFAKYEVGPDSLHVFFVAQGDWGSPWELYRVPLDGSEAPARLSADMPPGAQGLYDCSSALGRPAFAIAPGGERVVYRADQDAAGVFELYGVPADGSSPPVRLSGTLVPGGDVRDFFLDPTGERVLYAADQRVDERFELFSVSHSGDASVVSEPLVPGGNVGSYRSDDGLRVYYQADQVVNDRFELFAARIRGGGAFPVSAVPIAAGDVRLPSTELPWPFAITSDGTRVVYVADQDADEVVELFLSFVPGAGRASPRPR